MMRPPEEKRPLSRREWLAAGGLMLTAGRSVAQSARPFVLDCQSHLYVPDLVALMLKRSASTGGPRIAQESAGYLREVEARLH